ncbi:MAG TPA: AI-2E family transporter [Steroidobacteraceae bacterium]|nr:AI-2E family transporter [Steroidobacteraceae bacterium]
MSPGLETAPRGLRDYTRRILTAGAVLALLYFGRHVLMPLALAIMVSLLMAPAVRALRRIGIGRTSSVLIVVLTLAVSCLMIGVVLGAQVLRIAESLPQYEHTIHRKLKTLDEVTWGRVRVLASEASGLIAIHDPEPIAPAAAHAGQSERELALNASGPNAAADQPLHLIGKALTTVWTPLQGTGIVLLVTIFVLLEHESLRDRFIRIAGASDIRAMTLALNDASERLSRYFVSQTCVNLAFGVAIWAGLKLLGVPQAMLWGTLAGLTRFVPYVGVATVALFATALSFAVDSGWSLAVSTLALFILLDIVAAQLLEPRLYGHTTGLSPLAVVVGAILWSSLWGPVGLVLSTPLTLCLLVAGRHIKAFETLELLLGDVQPLTLPQGLYQRALAGDSHEVIANARTFLKSNSLARYCDRVLLPALHLARLDAERSATGKDQHRRIRRVIVEVVAALNSNGLRLQPRQDRGAVLDEVSAGRWLRQQREKLSGRWQGPLGVPAGSVVLCLGVGSSPDDLAAELLVRLLRAEKLDARHFSAGEIGSGLPPGADPDGVSIVYLVSAFPSPERERCEALSNQVRELFPRAHLVRVFCPGVTAVSGERFTDASAEPTANSLEHALALCLSWKHKHHEQGALATSTLADVSG